MVELSLLEDATARKELHELVRQHYLYTGSQLARTMLDNWSRYVEEFIQVTWLNTRKCWLKSRCKLQQKIAEVTTWLLINCWTVKTRYMETKAFLTVPRQEAGYRPVHDRIMDFSEVEQTLNTSERKAQASRWYGLWGTFLPLGMSVG